MPADPDYREFAPANWPDVEVLVDGVWCEGELRAWMRRDGHWYGNVQYRTAPGQTFLRTVPVEQIRQAEPPS